MDSDISPPSEPSRPIPTSDCSQRCWPQSQADGRRVLVDAGLKWASARKMSGCERYANEDSLSLDFLAANVVVVKHGARTQAIAATIRRMGARQGVFGPGRVRRFLPRRSRGNPAGGRDRLRPRNGPVLPRTLLFAGLTKGPRAQHHAGPSAVWLESVDESDQR